MEQLITTNSILMNQHDPEGDGRADPALDQEWQDEVAKRPSLEAKMQQVMMEIYMADPEKVRRVHKEAGKEIPEL
eukprot:6273514-Prymnesium_polylepis.1